MDSCSVNLVFTKRTVSRLITIIQNFLEIEWVHLILTGAATATGKGLHNFRSLKVVLAAHLA